MGFPILVKPGVHYRARTRTGNFAEMNYAISAYNPCQTREKCSIHSFPGQYHDCLWIVCGQSWDCPGIQSGMVRNVTDSACEKSKSFFAIRTIQGGWLGRPSQSWVTRHYKCGDSDNGELKLSDIANCIPWNNPPPPKKKGQFICIYKFN